MNIEGEGAWAVPLGRDVIRAAGPDATSFLQGQLSQDLDALNVGDAAFSLLLQPQGKMEVFLRLLRTSDEEYVLDTDAGWGEATMARLSRFKLRVRCDFEPLEWRCLAVRGAASAMLADPPEGSWRVLPETPNSVGFDLLGPDLDVPEGVEVADDEIYEALRIVEGVPRMGAEIDDSTIPATTGVIDRAVSFTKGCYTGQELVARIDSRGGKVPRRLLGVRSGGDDVPPVGADVVVAERVVGSLTSVARSVALGAVVALAYVRRDVEAPVDAEIRWDSASVGGRIEELPLRG